MKRTLSALLALAMVLALPLRPMAAVRAQNTGEIAGTAVVEGKPLPSITVRLRNVDNGQLAATTTTNERGEFKFTNLPVGNYVVETIAVDGSTLLGTSPRVALVVGAMSATGITVSTSAAAAAQCLRSHGCWRRVEWCGCRRGRGGPHAAMSGAFFATTAGS